MKALTVYQPWAWCIALIELPLQPGVAAAREGAGLPPLVPKLLENRDRKPPAEMVGELFAIHAGKRCEEGSAAELRTAGILLPGPGHFAHGVVAVARLAGVLGAEEIPPEQRFWYGGPYAWVLTDVVPLPTTIPTRGYPWHGWKVPAEVVEEIAAQGIDTGEGRFPASSPPARPRLRKRASGSPPPATW